MPSTAANRAILGFWVYIMSDCVLFAGLFATFAVLRGATVSGPEGAELFSLPFVLTETLILLTSSFTIGLALLAASNKRRSSVLILLVLTFALGAAFLYLELNEFHLLVAEGNGPARSAFLSSFFALVGTHGLHVALGALWMLTLFIQTIKERLSERVLWRLQCLGMFWHFLDIIWIFIFTFVYLFSLV